ncbi:uncharacterized protein LOC132611966 [Lycium barbarum]|uniref:uncharacterized protein LOC132611966 n=1 Tax=Lycium barbarum TaxID=112863 RepID=UPI00293EE32E|nr:uncharacterized protein LOC132611966 [Lycium barbarum]
MTIARIQAHAQNLEEQQQPQRIECDSDRGRSKKARYFGAGSEYRGGQRQQYSRHSSQSVASAPPLFAGKGFDRSIYSREGQSSRVLGSPLGGAPSQKRPSILRCNQCGKFHSGPCRHGSNACYACEQIGNMMRECPSVDGSGRSLPAGSMEGSSSSAHAQNLEEQQQPQRSERDSDRGRSKKARFFGAGSEYRGGQRQ